MSNVNWPDLTLDRQAWQIACNELPNAPLSLVLQRAQEIKELLKPCQFVESK